MISFSFHFSDLNLVIILSSDFTINFFFSRFDDIFLFLSWLQDVESHNFLHWSIPTGGMNLYFVFLFSFSCCFSLSLLFVIIFIIIWFSYFREVVRILRFWIKKIHVLLLVALQYRLYKRQKLTSASRPSAIIFSLSKSLLLDYNKNTING